MSTRPLRIFVLVALFAIAACSSEATDRVEQTDEEGSGDTQQVVTDATCSDLYAHVTDCYSDAGCPGLFVEDNFVSGCTQAGFSSTELGEKVSMTCEDTISFFCMTAAEAQNSPLSSSTCCK